MWLTRAERLLPRCFPVGIWRWYYRGAREGRVCTREPMLFVYGWRKSTTEKDSRVPPCGNTNILTRGKHLPMVARNQQSLDVLLCRHLTKKCRIIKLVSGQNPEVELELKVEIGIKLFKFNSYVQLAFLKIEFVFRTQFYRTRFQYKSLFVNFLRDK